MVLNAKIVSPWLLVDCWLSLKWTHTLKQQHLVCTIFAASDVRIFKGTQLPLFDLAILLHNQREREKPAPASKVNVWNVCGFTTQLLSKIWLYNSSITPSNIKLCEFESLIRGQDKILSTKESSLAILFQRANLVRGILFSLMPWKPLLCNCLNIQTFPVHRSRDENKVLHIKTNV